MKTFSSLHEDLRQWFNPNHPKGGWKRINSKGEAIGPCAREPGEAKPKCMSNEKRAKLSKKERASAVASKRKHDPNPERKGEPINVSNFGKGKISENMENLEEKNVPTSPEKWAQAKSQAKAKFDVYPSAYANGWAAKKYKEMGGGWKSVSEENSLLEKWSQKYKSSIDCDNPKGFSQKAHCDGKEKNEEVVYEGAIPAKEKTVTVRHKTSGKELVVTAQKAKELKQQDYHPIKEAKDEQEYGYEGDMALNQLATLTRCAEMIKDLLKPDTDMPEWVQSKITLATDYIQTAADYMYSEMKEVKEDVSKMPTDKLQKHWDSHKDEQRPSAAFASKLKMVAKELSKRKAMKKEEVEQVDEISQDLAGRYLEKVTHDQLKKSGMHHNLYGQLPPKRQAGVGRALDRLVVNKESVDSDGGPPTEAAATLTVTGQPKLNKTIGQTKLIPYVQEDAETDKKGSWKVETPWRKVKGDGTVTDKSGAKHTPMSRARDLARQAIKRKMEEQSNVKPNPFTIPSKNPGKADKPESNYVKARNAGSSTKNAQARAAGAANPHMFESRQLEIVREAMKVAKKKKEVTEAGTDKFIADPELTSQITKSNP